MIGFAENRGEQCATDALTLRSGGYAEEREVPVWAGHALVMDVLEVAVRGGETPIPIRPETALHLIHVAPGRRLWGCLRMRGGPDGDAVGPVEGRVAIDGVLSGAFSYELGKEPGKLAETRLDVGLRVNTEGVIDESSR